MTDGKKTKNERNMSVIKSNDLARARYNLTTQQQKIILYAISKIKPNDKIGQWYEISIDEICAVCGLDIDAGGFYYRTIKKDLQELTTRLWIIFPDKSEATVAWISDARIIPLSGKVYIKFHEALEQHLYNLREQFTQYKLYEILSFHNKYAIRLYEILRSYVSEEELKKGKETEKSFSVLELRNMLKVETYPQWGEFERNVIRKAIDEINKYSDSMRISYDIYKRGRKVEKVNFIITRPNETEQYISHQDTRKRLDGCRQSIKAEEVKPIIKKWREENPQGTRAECVKETGITKYAVYRYWMDENEKEAKENQRKRKLKELIENREKIGGEKVIARRNLINFMTMMNLISDELDKE